MSDTRKRFEGKHNTLTRWQRVWLAVGGVAIVACVLSVVSVTGIAVNQVMLLLPGEGGGTAPLEHVKLNVDIAKTLIGGIASILAAALVGSMALFTARFVTRKIEEMRIDAQYDIEHQKQRMELFKALYLERIAAAKQMMKFANECVLGLAKSKALADERKDRKEDGAVPEYFELYISFVTSVFMSEWLFTERVKVAAQEFVDFLRSIMEMDIDQLGEDSVTIQLTKCSEELGHAVSEMMLSDDLGRLVKK